MRKKWFGRKGIAAILTAAMVMGLTACGGGGATTGEPVDSSEETAGSENEAAEETGRRCGSAGILGRFLGRGSD